MMSSKPALPNSSGTTNSAIRLGSRTRLLTCRRSAHPSPLDRGAEQTDEPERAPPSWSSSLAFACAPGYPHRSAASRAGQRIAEELSDFGVQVGMTYIPELSSKNYMPLHHREVDAWSVGW